MVLDINGIRYFLKGTDNARIGDQKIFRMWEEGRMTTDEVIEQFKKNNLLDDKITILAPDMILFMNGLGFRRRKEWQEER